MKKVFSGQSIIEADILPITRNQAMVHGLHRRRWLLVAAIAISAALVLMLAASAHSGSAAVWLAVLPVCFIGVIAPLSLSPVPQCFHQSRAFDAPALQPSFQRPPPSRLG
jgi:hypothetical protein